MKCRYCGEEMVMEEYYTDFYDNDERVVLTEMFGCVKCNKTAIKYTDYKKDCVEEEYRD